MSATHPTGAGGQVVENSRGCVLVVEDDPLLRRVIVRILRSWGYTIVEASDGVSALDRVQESWEDLSVILLDIMLPILDGVEVARRVLAERPELPIVACSAALNDEIVDNLRTIGVRVFLPKPYSADALRDTLALAAGPESWTPVDHPLTDF